MKIINTEVYGFDAALRGMRNPKNSWHLNDTRKADAIEDFRLLDTICPEDIDMELTIIGEKDLYLAQNLIKSGTEHYKFLRQIQVWADFNMPLYWWSEFDTYHFNTKNSCSTMHTIMKRPLELSDFYLGKEIEDIIKPKEVKENIIVPIVLPKGIKEEWKDIKGFEGRYKISNRGEIVRYSVVDEYEDRIINRKEKVIKPSINNQGYLKVGLNKDGKYYNRYIHRLIAETFIDNPLGKPCVNHIDGNKLNNNLNNLEWVTQKENTIHAHSNGLAEVTEYNKWKVSKANRMFTNLDILNIKNMYNEGKTQKEIAEIYKCYDSTISQILNNKRYSRIGDYEFLEAIEEVVNTINVLRVKYIETKDYSYVIRMKRLLPTSYKQLRTVNTNYAELRNIYFQRKNHRLEEEWQDTFCKWVESLPYAKELILYK